MKKYWKSIKQELRSFRGRILLAILIFSLLPLLIGSLIIYLDGNALNKQVRHELQALAIEVASDIDTNVRELQVDAAAVAALPDVKSLNIEKMSPVMKTMFNHYGRYGQMAYARLDGQLLFTAREQELVSIAHVPSFQHVVANNEQALAIFPALFGPQLIMHMHTPIQDDEGNLTAVLGHPLPLSRFSEVLQRIAVDGSQAYVIDKEGLIIMHNDPEQIEVQLDMLDVAKLYDENLAPVIEGSMELEQDDVQYIASHAPISTLGWTAVVQRPKKLAQRPIVYTRLLTSGLLLYGSLLLAVSALAVAGKLVNPVQALIRVAKAMEHGKFSVPLPEKSGVEEVDTLINSFGTMRKAVLDREEFLRESEQRIRSITKSIPDILLRINNDGQIIDGSLPPQSNLSLSNFIGENIYTVAKEMASPETATKMKIAGLQTLANEQPDVIISEFSLGQRPEAYEVRFATIGEEELLVILRSLKEQRIAKESELKMVGAMEASTDGMAILDQDFNHVYINKAYANLYGIAEDSDLVQLSFYQLVAQKERNQLSNDIAKSLLKDNAWLGECCGINGRGEEFYEDISITRLDSGEHVLVARDITEKKMAEQAMMHSQKLESLGVMAGGIAHDFNNLLGGIVGQINIAKSKLGEDDSATKHLDKAGISLKRAGDLTNQILAYSGKGRFQMGVINLNEVIDDSMVLMETAVSKPNIITKLDPALPIIKGDSGQLQQIVMNLVINAVEAADETNGRVLIQTGKQQVTDANQPALIGGSALGAGTYVSMRVVDSGVGIDDKTLQRIFDPFFTTKDGGLGLGLSATLGILQSNGGGVQVDSKIGKGTMFQVFWPAAEPVGHAPKKSDTNPQSESDSILAALSTLLGDPVDTVTDEIIPPLAMVDPAPTSAAKPIAQVALKSTIPDKSILVVDDEMAMREVIQDILELNDMDVIVAKNGLEAIEVYEAHQEKISAVLLDIRMPIMNGLDALEKLRGLNPDIKVIMMSGYSETEIEEINSEKAPFAFMKKPFSMDIMIDKLNSALIPA